MQFSQNFVPNSQNIPTEISPQYHMNPNPNNDTGNFSNQGTNFAIRTQNFQNIQNFSNIPNNTNSLYPPPPPPLPQNNSFSQNLEQSQNPPSYYTSTSNLVNTNSGPSNMAPPNPPFSQVPLNIFAN